MFLNFTTMLQSTVIAGGDAAPAVVEAAAPAAEGAGSFLGGMGATGGIVIYIALFGALYFFLIRPQRKREKEMKQMQASLGVGDNIVTTAGLFGSISGVGEDCFIVEFGINKGVRIPIRKTDIVGKRVPNITNAKEIVEEKN